MRFRPSGVLAPVLTPFAAKLALSATRPGG
jgi:hypothetical protein